MFLCIETILRYNEFGADDGPVAKEFATKFSVLQRNLSSKLGVRVPDVDVRAFWCFYSLDQLFHQLPMCNLIFGLTIFQTG